MRDMDRSRRRFLALAGACLAGTAVVGARSVRAMRPVRVRGAVRRSGTGIGGVAVSDGLEVVATGSDGTFELVTSDARSSIQVSVPCSCRIPRGPPGIARMWVPLRPDAKGEATAVFDFEPLPTPSDRHTMLLLADIQTQDEEEMTRFENESIPDVRRTVEEHAGVETFAVACGDIMYDRLELFPEYEREAARVGIPFLQVVGNHDLDLSAATDPGSTRTFTARFGPRYYSFERGAVHYVVLDDVFWLGADYVGRVDDEQMRWLAADLSLIEHGRTVVVLLHIPAKGTHDVRHGAARPAPSRAVTNRDALLELLGPYRTHLLAGHMHETEHEFGRGFHEHVGGAVCGAWWTGPICADGTPNGYAVYEVAGEAVSWTYKATGKPLDHQMQLYTRGRLPDAPDEILANVWDWDPEWKVLWFEDGHPRGPMTRRPGTDPTSVDLYGGPDKPRKRLFVDPFTTDHLFRARPAAGTRSITVEATDRFGRVRRDTLML